jgi:hypothetical protein
MTSGSVCTAATSAKLVAMPSPPNNIPRIKKSPYRSRAFAAPDWIIAETIAAGVTVSMLVPHPVQQLLGASRVPRGARKAPGRTSQYGPQWRQRSPPTAKGEPWQETTE